MQPPPRGCVLKRLYQRPLTTKYRKQPPPRGCVLKQNQFGIKMTAKMAAASARLCVETTYFATPMQSLFWQPPPRGCVLKQSLLAYLMASMWAAASARLCVETDSYFLR